MFVSIAVLWVLSQYSDCNPPPPPMPVPVYTIPRGSEVPERIDPPPREDRPS